MPAPARRFHSGQRPARTPPRTAASDGVTSSIRSPWRRLPCGSVGAQVLEGDACPRRLSRGSRSWPPKSTGPKRTRRAAAKTASTRQGTGSYHRRSAAARIAPSNPTHRPGSRSTGLHSVTAGSLARGMIDSVSAMFRVATQLFRFRGLLATLTSRELKARYRGSVLGFLWSLANPLLLLAVYTFVFSVVFKPRTQGATPTPCSWSAASSPGSGRRPRRSRAPCPWWPTPG